MLKSNIVDQVNQQISQIMANSPLSEVERNLKAIVVSILNKLDLVTREEFDTQQKILIATRQKLEDLEAQLHKFTSDINK